MKEINVQRTANRSGEGDEVENQNPRWLRIREVAAELRVSETTVRSWLLTGKLEGCKIGGVVRVDREAINKLVKTYPYQAPVSQGRPSGRSTVCCSLCDVAYKARDFALGVPSHL